MDQKTLKRLCTLARLEISEKEEKGFEDRLQSIIEHFKKIKEIDTKGVEPLINPSEQSFILRADEPEDFLEKEALVSQAPSQEKGFYKAPKILD